MSDAERRRLAREAVRGDPQARERQVQADLRAGVVQGRDVELAAYLGDPVAGAVSGRAAVSIEPLRDFMEGLGFARPEGLARLAVAGARPALAAWSAYRSDDSRLPEALEAADRALGDDAVVLQPQIDVVLELGVEAQGWEWEVPAEGDELGLGVRAAASVRGVKHALWCVEWSRRRASRFSLIKYARIAWFESAQSLAPSEGGEASALERLLGAARGEVVDWALGCRG